MGEEKASDNSWKKLVISKTNNDWITVKAEFKDVDKVVTSAGFSNEDFNYDNIKKEKSSNFEENHIIDEQAAPVTMTQEIDPLSITNTPRMRRRKGQGQRNESEEERVSRLAKMSAYAAQRLANETPEQRSVRLRRMSEYASRRLAQESSEQRAKRLARMSAYAAKRLSEETPEQRSTRLARMSAYAARRQAMKKFMSTNQNLLDVTINDVTSSTSFSESSTTNSVTNQS